MLQLDDDVGKITGLQVEEEVAEVLVVVLDMALDVAGVVIDTVLRKVSVSK